MPEIPAALRALQALGAPDYMDYDFLMSITGMAVRLAWQPGWAAYQGLPNQAVFPDGTGFDYALRAVDGAGAKYIVKSLTDTVLARKEIQAAIDKGKPVLLDEPFVCSTVLGYKENVLYGVSTFAPPEERTQPYQYTPLNNWCEQTKRYVLIERLLPQPVDRQLLAQTIKRDNHHGPHFRMPAAPRALPWDCPRLMHWRKCWCGMKASRYSTTICHIQMKSPVPIIVRKVIGGRMAPIAWQTGFGRDTAIFCVCSMVMKICHDSSTNMPILFRNGGSGFFQPPGITKKPVITLGNCGNTLPRMKKASGNSGCRKCAIPLPLICCGRKCIP